MTRPASPPPSGSGEVRLDLDLAQEAVRELEAVKESLIQLRQDAQEVGRQAVDGRSARDAISVEASVLLAEKADGTPGSFGLAVDAGIKHVEVLVNQMKADIDAQRAVDEAAADLRVS